MQLIKKVFYFLFLILIALSCVDKSNQLKKESIEDVIAFIINENSFPLPPPPIFIDDSIVNTVEVKIIDSLKSISLNVAIYPIISNLSFDKENDNKRKILKALLKDNFDIESINRKSKHNVVFADTLIINKSKDWKEYDLLFHFSKLSINQNLDSANMSVGISRSSLWGQAYEFFLKKEKEGKWIIEKTIEKEKW